MKSGLCLALLAAILATAANAKVIRFEEDVPPIVDDVIHPSEGVGKGVGDRAESIWSINHRAGLNLYQGDILLDPSGILGVLDETKRWTGGKVPYVYNGDSSLMPAILSSISQMNSELSGCISVVPRTNEDNYINIIDGNGCYSALGMLGGEQELSLSSGCEEPSHVLHEFAHALGLDHEQCRPDRDNYVTILWQNIPNDYTDQFEKANPSVLGTFDTPYDYMSIMHYEATAASPDGQITIQTADPTFQYKIGTTSTYSEQDKIRIRKMYKCP